MAIFNNDSDEFRRYSYTIDTFQILIGGGDTYDLPALRFNSLMILNNYENYLRPIFRCEIVLESSVYYEILKNKDNVQFRIRLLKYYDLVGKVKYNDNLEDETNSKISYMVFDDLFDLILNDSDVDNELGFKEEEAKYDNENLTEDDVNKLEEVDNVCEFFLFKAEDVKNSQVMVNAILNRCSVSDAVAYILSKAGISNVLMSIPDNQRIYDSILIPPLPAYKAIAFIDSYYGLYRNGMMMYFALDKTYIIKYHGLCTAYTTDEIKETTIVVPKKTSDYADEPCTVYTQDSSSVNYIMASQDNVTISNGSITNDVVFGNDANILDEYSTGITAVNTSAISKGNSNSTKTVINKTENIFYSEIYQSQVEAQSVILDVSIRNFDIGAIAPNKLFTIVFEDSSITEKYNGNYLLTYAYHYFSKSSTGFDLTSSLILKKTEGGY